MFAVTVSRINRQVSFPTITTWSFVSLPSVTVAERLAKLNIKENKIKIKKYIFLKEELAPKTYITN